jgi:hypothetical protein
MTDVHFPLSDAFHRRKVFWCVFLWCVFLWWVFLRCTFSWILQARKRNTKTKTVPSSYPQSSSFLHLVLLFLHSFIFFLSVILPFLLLSVHRLLPFNLLILQCPDQSNVAFKVWNLWQRWILISPNHRQEKQIFHWYKKFLFWNRCS